MNAIGIISQLANQGVTLWADNDGLHYEGKSNAITPSIIDVLKNNKQALIDELVAPAANDEPLPTRWSVALSIIDDMVKEKHSQMLYDEAPVRIQRGDWRKRYQIALSLNDWETERLEQDLRANKWVYFNYMFDVVERTSPDFEIAANAFIDWADSKGIAETFFWLPTGTINHGRIRELPSSTVKGLNAYMMNC